MNNYPTNLTDNQWEIIEKFVDVQAGKRKYPVCETWVIHHNPL